MIHDGKRQLFLWSFKGWKPQRIYTALRRRKEGNSRTSARCCSHTVKKQELDSPWIIDIFIIFWSGSAKSVWRLLSQPSALLRGEELREVPTWISIAFISGTRVTAMALDVHCETNTKQFCCTIALWTKKHLHILKIVVSCSSSWWEEYTQLQLA